MPQDLTEEEAENWIAENIGKYGNAFLLVLKKSTSYGKKAQKIIDTVLKYKNGKAFLNGIEITADGAGVLRWGKKFLYDPTKGTANSTKNLFKTSNGLFKNGENFEAASGIKLTSYNYKQYLNSGMQKFKESVNPLNDFKNWKDATKLGKFGKGLGIVSTVLNVGSNFSKDVDLSDGIQGEEAKNFVIDTTIDIGSSAGASALGATIGSAFLPPLGTVVGAVSGMAISSLINDVKFGKPPKSAVNHVKDATKKAVGAIGDRAKKMVNKMGSMFSGIKFGFGGY